MEVVAEFDPIVVDQAVCPSRIVLLHQDMLDLWDASGAYQASVEEISIERIERIALSHDGAVVATVFFDDSTVHLYSGFTGAHTRPLDGDWGQVSLLSFSPNGALAIGTDNGTLTIWNTDYPHLHPKILQGNAKVCNVAFSSDDAYIASAFYNGTIILWSVTEGSQKAYFHCENRLDHIYISGDHRFIVGLTSSPAMARLTFPLPQEFWKDEINASNSLEYFDAFGVHNDGWLYSEEQQPRRRVCWVPVEARPARFSDGSGYRDRVEHWIKNVYITESGTVAYIMSTRSPVN
jgi:WD40 repeat protein